MSRVFSTDHKVIGLQYGLTSLLFTASACTRCGLGHYRMRGVVIVESQADFEAFLASEAEVQVR